MTFNFNLYNKYEYKWYKYDSLQTPTNILLHVLYFYNYSGTELQLCNCFSNKKSYDMKNNDIP